VSTGRAVYESVRAQGVGHVFCVPGESYLSVMNAFHESSAPRLIATRHEEGAGLMAEAYAKATGGVGVCMVTRGPGLTHLAIALHTAQQDSTPLVALVGQVPSEFRYREAFQEMDVVAFARPMTKWALEINRGDRTAELMQKAFHVATSGRPGPVVVSLPEDVDRDSVSSVPARRGVVFAAAPAQEGIAGVADLLRAASRPVIVVGGGITRAGATPDLVRLAEAVQAPVYTAWRRFDAFPNNHPLYLGPLPSVPADLAAPLLEADVILALGTRLGENTTKSYTWPVTGQRLVHIDISAEDAGNGWAGADIAIVSDVGRAVKALIENLGAVDTKGRAKVIASARVRYMERTTPRPYGPGAPAGQISLEGVYCEILRRVPDSASITCDAGTFGGWLVRYYRWNYPRTLFAPTAGGMGYALPAAVGAKLARPDQPVIAFAGDGGFAMTMSEIETAVRLGLRGFVALVFNNNNYGTITAHQMREFPGRSVATTLGDIDFATAAEGMGALGYTVRTNADFARALDSALKADKPAVLNIIYDSQRLSPWADERKVRNSSLCDV
jgi:acetolactate synthase I/II/III large subunit